MLMKAEIELFELETECYLVAVGLPDCANNSVTKNQGMLPGPVANPTTKRMTLMMAR